MAMQIREPGCARSCERFTASPSATAAAFYVCALGSYDELKAMLSRCDRGSTAGLLLAATILHCDGDVLRAESTLRRAMDIVSETERPYVADTFAALLVARGVYTRAADVLGAAAIPPTFEAGRLALRSVIDAATGSVKLSVERAGAARDALARLDDDVFRVRVHQRLAMAAYFRGQAHEALDDVAQGLHSAHLLAARRAACALHAVAYAAHCGITGDFDAAWRHASAIAREADLGGDDSFRALARVAIFELAAERGDDAKGVAACDAPERFAGSIANVLRLGWRGAFASCRSALVVLGETTGRTDGERALCRALLALVSAASGDDDAARRLSRQAIAAAGRPAKHAAAHEIRHRRIARALAAAASDLAGDVLLRRRPDTVAAALSAANVRGYARFVDAVKETLVLRPSKGPLTAAEIEILRLLDAGRNAPQIAAVLCRSPHTVRTHIRNAGAKLEARGRIDMLARARQLGIVATV